MIHFSIIHFVCHQIIYFELLQPHGWADNAETEVAILVLGSTWLITDEIGWITHEFNTKSPFHTLLCLLPYLHQILLHSLIP